MKSTYKRNLLRLTLILLALLLISNSNSNNNYLIQNPVNYSGYSNVFSRTVDPVNLTAGMSYNSMLNYKMNNSNNLLEIPAPQSQEFNASFVNVTMGNIMTSDVNLYVQTYNKRGQFPLESNRRATSFTISSNCYLTKASFYFNIIAGNPIFSVRLHNSTWNETLGTNQPYGNPFNPDDYKTINTSTPGVSGAGWVNFTFNISPDTYLNNSRTDNNTWYICLAVGAGSVQWNYELDGEIEDDDNSLAYHYSSPNWLLTSDSGDTVDYTAKFGFSNSETIYSQKYNKRGQLPLESNRLATSFTVPSNCYLTNASFYLNVTAGDPIVAVRLHNSTWNETLGMNQPYGNPFNPNDYKVLNISTLGVSGAQWVNFSFPISEDSFLDNSKTHNNTWYFGLVSGMGSVNWIYELDGENEVDDNSLAYHFSFPKWLLTTDSSDTIDYTLQFGISLSSDFTQILQTYNKRGQSIVGRDMTSFTVPSNCYITNGSFYFNIAGNPTIEVHLHNSTWNETLSVSQPYGDPYNPNHYRVINISTPGLTGDVWLDFTFNLSADTYLNNSKTENNTWFIGFGVVGGALEWKYELDGENIDDDKTLSYYYSWPYWYLTKDSGDTVDYTSILGFSSGLNYYLQTHNKRDQSTVGRDMTSFTVPSNCYITNGSFYFNIVGNPTIEVHLHNSTWNETLSVSQPYGDPYNPNHYRVINISTPGLTGDVWLNFTFNLSADTYLNNSKTENNTWFIGFGVVGGALEWKYELDGDDIEEDKTLSYYYSWPYWYLTKDSGDTVDYTSILSFKIIDLTIKPSDVGLKINKIPVRDANNPIYTGQWISTQILRPRSDGRLILDVTTDFGGVSWTIYNISVKYTKADIKATTNFTIQIGSTVNWEVNQPVEVYNNSFTDFILNFTVSDTWTITDCYNISSADPHTFLEWDKPGPYKEISIDDAGNSTNWRLICTSINFAKSISIFVDSINSTTVHFLDDLQFVARFDGKIIGDVNLTIYSSSGFINYTTVFSSISEMNEVTFPLVDLSDFISEYGNYIVQYHWFNATYVAYLEEHFIVLANTQLSLISPPQDTEFTPNDTFNITLYYQDIGIIGPIDDATIYYEIDGGGTQLVNKNNGTSGYYEILIDCSTLGTGYKTVELSANKTLYESQSLEYDFSISSPSADGGGNTLLIIAIIVPIVAILAVVGIIFYLKKKK